LSPLADAADRAVCDAQIFPQPLLTNAIGIDPLLEEASRVLNGR